MDKHPPSFRGFAIAGFFVSLLAAAAMLPNGANATHIGTHIVGTTGEVIDGDAPFGGFYLRYTGNPAPAGYSHNYQWGEPQISADPASGPVSFEGSLDFSGRDDDNSVSMIGLLDTDTLENGASGFQTGADIDVNNRTNGQVRVGPSDGNTGGEIVQTFVGVPDATADAGPIDVTFTVDGTADPAGCATNVADVASAEGCLTLEIDGFPTLTDSYGSITGSGGPSEFSGGATPGWEVYNSEQGKTGFDLTITPAEVPLTNKDQCKNSGWQEYGFKNQGQCVRFVETGKDSR